MGTGAFLFNLLKLLALLALVLINAFFVAAEFSLISVRRSRIVELINQGNQPAKWVQKAIENPDRVIAATQLGITLASLGLGWIGEPFLAQLIEPVLRWIPPTAQSSVSHALSAGLAFAVITFLHVVVGELAPKSIALQSPEHTSLAVARPTLWSERLFKPAIWLLNGAGNLLLRLIRVRPAAGHERVHSVAELKILVSDSAKSGVVEGGEEEMVHAILDFGDTLVRQVMVPRTELVAVPSHASLDDMLEAFARHRYTKLPVYEGSLDQVIGVLHARDVLLVTRRRRKPSPTARDLMREAIFVPDSAPASSLLEHFRALRQHIAIVLDEFGGTAGIVTLGDLLEEIVGKVGDVFTPQPADIQPLPDGTALIDGLTTIQAVNEHFGLQLSDPHYQTLAGYMIGRLGRLGLVGDVVTVHHAQLRVEALDGLRISRISLSPSPPGDVRRPTGGSGS